MNDYIYVIADISELNTVNYNEVMQTSSSTVRKNIEQTRFVLKFSGSTPSTIETLDLYSKLFSYNDEKYFNHSDILDIMSTPEWTGTQSII